jgi:hypothetical protein
MLTDEDRKLIAYYREWSHADMTPTWFVVGVLGVFATGLVIVNALNGAIASAVGLAVLGAIVAYATVRSTQRQLRLAQLITKLASLAPLKPVDPSANRTPTSPAEPS